MRHIELATLLPQIFADADGNKSRKSLERAQKRAAGKPTPEVRKKYIDDNGGGKWKPIKDRLTEKLGKKCWYTEVELIGAPLAIDHYRPVCDYWWLAFDAENYRVACHWSNSPEHNVLHGCAGGKGMNFPLLPPGIRATVKGELPNEQPILLDPCNEADCALLAFRADGRPVLNPDFAGDPIAARRVSESVLLLNLDHPDFNSKREELCLDISTDVSAYEALPVTDPSREVLRARLAGRITANAPFSTAARFYLKLHRNLGWVDDLLATR